MQRKWRDWVTKYLERYWCHCNTIPVIICYSSLVGLKPRPPGLYRPGLPVNPRSRQKGGLCTTQHRRRLMSSWEIWGITDYTGMNTRTSVKKWTGLESSGARLESGRVWVRLVGGFCGNTYLKRDCAKLITWLDNWYFLLTQLGGGGLFYMLFIAGLAGWMVRDLSR